MTYAATIVFNPSRMPANAGQFKALAPLKIGEFRRLIDRLSHARNWLTGGTADEFKRQSVAAQLEPIVAELVDALALLPTRFASDAESARQAIEYARRVIQRWHAVQ